jgi:cytochrome c nitrite reductase small subunit
MRLLVNSLLGILLGTCGYTFYYAQGASYLSSNPQACVNCHVMRDHFESWEKASHHALAKCSDCHMPHDFAGKWLVKAESGYHHSLAFTLWNFRDPIRIKPQSAGVLNTNCLYCHKDFVREITAHRVSRDEGLYCVRCHDGVGHGPGR